MPIRRPAPMAMPPRIIIRSMLRITFVFRNFALTSPRISKLNREIATDVGIATAVVFKKINGARGISPSTM